MLPTSVSGNGVVWRSQRSNHGALATYLRRLARPSQMDFGCGERRCMKPPVAAFCAQTAVCTPVASLMQSPAARRYAFWLMLQLCIAPKTA